MFQQDQTTIKNQVLTWSRDLTPFTAMEEGGLRVRPGLMRAVRRRIMTRKEESLARRGRTLRGGRRGAIRAGAFKEHPQSMRVEWLHIAIVRVAFKARRAPMLRGGPPIAIAKAA